MEKKDPIEDKFGTAFGNFESEPPPGMWEQIHRDLHPGTTPPAWWNHLPFSFFLHKSLGFYLAISGISFGLIFSVFYFGPGRRHDIRGHAYAGQLRMQQGTATLFISADRALPWDSLTFQRSAIIDRYGHFRFPRVPEGNYVLRIAPDPLSEEGRKFLASWYDRCEVSDSCRRFSLSDRDLTLEVHLKER